MVLEDSFLCPTHVPRDCQHSQIFLRSFNFRLFRLYKRLTLTCDGAEQWVVILDAEKRCEMEQLVDVLEDKGYVVEAVPTLVLDLHLG